MIRTTLLSCTFAVCLAPVAAVASHGYADSTETAGGTVRMYESVPQVDDLRHDLMPETPRRTRGIEIRMAPRPAAPSYATPAAAITRPAPPRAPVTTAPAPRREPAPAPAAVTQAPAPTPAPAAPEAPASREAQAAPDAIGFRIQFAFDSAAIQAVSRPYLDRLGELLREEGDLRLVVEGHTDATGPEAYNSALSQRRAVAVAAYLNQVWSVDGSRMRVVGKGEAEPLTRDPDAPANRRVQFRVR